MVRILAGSQGLLWSLNARAVLDVLDADGPLGRPELVTTTGLSRTTIAQTVAELVDTEVVIEVGLDRTRRGPAAQLYGVNPDAAFGLAVQCSATQIVVALVDLTGAVRANAAIGLVSADIATTLGTNSHRRVAGLIADLAHECREQAGVPSEAQLRTVTVGVNAVVSPDRRTLRAIPGYAEGGAELHDGLADALGCPVVMENDVNLSALAELREGAGRTASGFAVLSLDRGFGAALVIGGSLHRGVAGGAGEVAYLPQPGVSLGSPSLSTDAVADLAAAAGLDSRELLGTYLAQAETGNTQAQRLVDAIGERIAIAAASVSLVVEPERVILSGDAAHPLLLTATVRATVDRLAPLSMVLVASELGADATLRGAIGETRAALRETVFGEATRSTDLQS